MFIRLHVRTAVLKDRRLSVLRRDHESASGINETPSRVHSYRRAPFRKPARILELRENRNWPF
jgi:hypothetical protein